MSDTPQTEPGALLKVSEAEIVQELGIPANTLAKFDAVILEGDYSKLTSEERSQFIRLQCKRAGLAPDLNPIMFIPTAGKLVPYMKKGAAEQLRAMHRLSAEVTEKWSEAGFVYVSVRVSGADGRFEDDIGSAPAGGGDAYKKAITAAKRRATLGYCGMGALDPREDPEDGNGNGSGPKRVIPPPVDPGARHQSALPVFQPTVNKPSEPRSEVRTLPDPKTGGVVPPIAIPTVAKPKVK